MSNSFSDYFGSDSYDLAGWIEENLNCDESESIYLASCVSFFYQNISLLIESIAIFGRMESLEIFVALAEHYIPSFDRSDLLQYIYDDQFIARLFHSVPREQLVVLMESIGSDYPRES
jgi:hypothetical protein